MANINDIMLQASELQPGISRLLRNSTYPRYDDLSGLEINYEDGEQLCLLDERRGVMEKLAEKGFAGGNTMKVVTAFRGTRVNPELRGSISGIDEDNFTPEEMVCGVLEGMVRELFELYGQIHAKMGLEVKRLVASGNGLRKNRVLREIFSQMFEAELTLAPYEEEAAYGAAVGGILS